MCKGALVSRTLVGTNNGELKPSDSVARLRSVYALVLELHSGFRVLSSLELTAQVAEITS